jgi:hypothetical protein
MVKVNLPEGESHMTFDTSPETGTSEKDHCDTVLRTKLLVCIYTVEQKKVDHIRLHPVRVLEMQKGLRFAKGVLSAASTFFALVKLVKDGASLLRNVLTNIAK